MTAAPIRPVLSLLILAAGLAAAERARPGWWRLWGRAARSATRLQLVEPPRPECEVAVRRIKAKAEVSRKLCRGELSLFEAGAWFRDLNAEPADGPERYVRRLPGGSLNEKTCRQVILWATGQLAHEAPESQVLAFRCRLEEELERHLAEHGTVVLPGWE